MTLHFACSLPFLPVVFPVTIYPQVPTVSFGHDGFLMMNVLYRVLASAPVIVGVPARLPCTPSSGLTIGGVETSSTADDDDDDKFDDGWGIG